MTPEEAREVIAHAYEFGEPSTSLIYAAHEVAQENKRLRAQLAEELEDDELPPMTPILSGERLDAALSSDEPIHARLTATPPATGSADMTAQQAYDILRAAIDAQSEHLRAYEALDVLRVGGERLRAQLAGALKALRWATEYMTASQAAYDAVVGDIENWRPAGMLKALGVDTDQQGSEQPSAPPASAVELRWHYGPTPADPDPGKMWHYDCGGLVMYVEDGWSCGKCGASMDDPDQVPLDPGVLKALGVDTDQGKSEQPRGWPVGWEASMTKTGRIVYRRSPIQAGDDDDA